jgi:hypothetical protein
MPSLVSSTPVLVVALTPACRHAPNQNRMEGQPEISFHRRLRLPGYACRLWTQTRPNHDRYSTYKDIVEVAVGCDDSLLSWTGVSAHVEASDEWQAAVFVSAKQTKRESNHYHQKEYGKGRKRVMQVRMEDASLASKKPSRQDSACVREDRRTACRFGSPTQIDCHQHKLFVTTTIITIITIIITIIISAPNVRVERPVGSWCSDSRTRKQPCCRVC